MKIVLDWIENGDERIKHIKRYLKYRAVRTESDLYVKYECGPEKYYRHGEYDNDLLGKGEYRERIELLKGIIGDEWVNREELSEEMKLIYEAVKNGTYTDDF